MSEKKSNQRENLAVGIIEASDVCVRCGLCLPHCPTYQLSEVETESPRGRIAMAKALAEHSVPLTQSMQTHLDNCLSCLACEAMCPAKVPYHQLLVNTRELQAQIQKPHIPFLLNFLLNHLSLTPWLQRAYQLYNRSGLAWLFEKTRLAKWFGLDHYLSFMPKKLSVANFKTLYLPNNLPNNVPNGSLNYPTEKIKGHVALFLGCINPLCDAKTIYKTIELLNALNYAVHIPKTQACCGAIHIHNGGPTQAEAYAKHNAKLFDGLSDTLKSDTVKLDAIITLASGCNSSAQQLHMFSEKNIPVIDFNAFLDSPFSNQASNQDGKDLKTTFKINLNNTLLVHTPCTLKNSMKQPRLLFELLEKLGAKNISPLEGYGCCGAAGLTMWNNPTLADALVTPLIQQIAAEKPDFVVTANIGCQLHLQKNLRKIGLKTHVLHPANLIFSKNQQKT